MKVIRSKIMGFCAGVRRAVNVANKALEENDNGQVYTFGPLIHNPIALKKFEEKKLSILTDNEIDSLKMNDTVIIRAHGVPPILSNKLESTGAKVINATCPLVQESQKKAQRYAEQGYSIIFAGDKNHGEVVGIEGYANEGYLKINKKPDFNLIRNLEDANNLILKKSFDKVVLMSQTTFSISVFDELSDFFKNKLSKLEIIKSICPATHERQSSLVELCKKVDGVLIIGGKNSANTNRLYKTAKSLCQYAALIETKEEIPQAFFDLNVIGLTAGASTPDDIIDEVETALRNID